MSKEKKDKHFIKKAYFEGGMKAMRAFITKELKYPKAALEAKIEGTVHIKYTVNHLGKVVDAKVVNGPGYGCEEEAIRLVKLLKFKVEKTRKIRVLFHKTLQIHFRLPQEKENKVAPSNQLNIQYEVKKETTPKEEKKKGGGYGYVIKY